MAVWRASDLRLQLHHLIDPSAVDPSTIDLDLELGPTLLMGADGWWASDQPLMNVRPDACPVCYGRKLVNAYCCRCDRHWLDGNANLPGYGRDSYPNFDYLREYMPEVFERYERRRKAREARELDGNAKAKPG